MSDPGLHGTLAGNETNCPAWTCDDLHVLLGSAPSVNTNVALSGWQGKFPRRPLDDERTETTHWRLNGNYAPNGDPYTNAKAGLAVNRRLFTAAFRRATPDANGQVAVEFPDADGSSMTGSVQIVDERFGDGDEFEQVATLDIVIPRGELELEA